MTQGEVAMWTMKIASIWLVVIAAGLALGHVRDRLGPTGHPQGPGEEADVGLAEFPALEPERTAVVTLPVFDIGPSIESPAPRPVKRAGRHNAISTARLVGERRVSLKRRS